MHIKEVRLTGFASFRQQTTIEDLSSGVNVIIGRNGVGKSNLFAAIQFVLRQGAFEKSADELRQIVLSVGASALDAVAQVELGFAGASGPQALAGEIRVSRTLAAGGQDEYSVNGRAASRESIAEILDLSGFSRYNDFYVVSQGRVAALAISEDKDRLGLLMAVAGADAYARHRNLAVGLTSNSEEILTGSEAVLVQVTEHLAEMDLEMSDVRALVEFTERRTLLEAAIADREGAAASVQLEGLEEIHRAELAEYRELQATLHEAEAELARVLIEHSSQLTTVQTAASRRDMRRASMNSLARQRAHRASELKALRHNAVRLQDMVAELDRTRDKNDRSLRAYKDELAAIEDAISAEQPQQYEAILAELAEAKARIGFLQQKKGRYSQLDSAGQRNRWLANEVKLLETELEQISNAQAELATQRLQTAALSSQATARRTNTATKSAALQKTEEQISAGIKAGRQKVRNIERRIHELQLRQRELEIAREGLGRDVEALGGRHTLVSPDILKSLSLVDEAAHDLGLVTEVLGTVIELVEIETDVRALAQSLLGSAMLNTVVRTSSAAEKLLAELSTAAATVTLMPLDRLAPSSLTVEDGTLLATKFHTAPEFADVVRTLAGNVVLCGSLGLARGYAQRYGVLAALPTGEFVHPRGALSSQKLIEADYAELMATVGAFRELMARRKEIAREQREVQVQLARMDEELDESHREVNVIAVRIDETRDEQAQVMEALRSTDAEVERLAKLGHDHEDEMQALARKRSAVEQRMRDLEADITKTFNRGLTEAEEQELTELLARTRLDSLQAERQGQQLSFLDAEHTRVAAELRVAEQAVAAIDAQKAELTANKADAEASSAEALAALDVQLGATEAELDAAETELAGATALLADLASQRDAQQDTVGRVERQARKLEAQMDERAARQASLQTAQAARYGQLRRLRGLRGGGGGGGGGDADDGGAEDTAGRTLAELEAELNTLNAAPPTASDASLGAIERLTVFRSQAQEAQACVAARRADLAAVRELVARLDEEKARALELAFRALAQRFAAAFARLAPGGSGRLIVRRTPAGEVLGFSIDALFEGQARHRMEQLSTGQRAVCALALLFAVLGSHRVPFYVLDEIDANLDPQYRQGVAAAIADLAAGGGGAQVICTTFRRELLEVADRVYGVEFGRNGSTVQPLTREAAAVFIREQEAIEGDPHPGSDWPGSAGPSQLSPTAFPPSSPPGTPAPLQAAATEPL